MPTPRKGTSKKKRREWANKEIGHLVRDKGYPQKQAVAAGLSAAGLGKKKKRKGSKRK